MFEFVDIYPTLADIFKLKNTPSYLEGKSFKKMLKDPSKPFRNSVSSIVNRGKMLGRMVKNADWRYIEWDDAKMGVELYNQHKDPTEYYNLASDPAYAKVIEQMKQLMHKK